MGYKQRSSGLPFKEMGSSPAKQSYPSSAQKGSFGPRGTLDEVNRIAKSNVNAKTNMKIDLHLENKKALNQKIAKVTKTPTSTLSRVTKALKNTPKQLAKGGKQILKKGGKFLGGKALGVAGMMMATSSKADQPKKGKGKVEYPGGKIDFTSEK